MGATMNGVLTLPTWGKLAKGSRRRRSFRQIREDGPLGQQLKRHLRTKTSRQNFVTFLAAKMIALAIIAILVKLTIVFLGDIAAAQDATPAAPAVTLSATDSAISAINTTWTLVAAFLVFCMQAGFMMLEAGFARERESVNVLLECIVDTCLCGLLFWAFGFMFMFGTGNGWIGTQSDFFFLGVSPTAATYGSTGVAMFAFWIFQYAFADTCSTITSGSMVGRTGFMGDLLYSIGVSGFIYPILGHWAWGPGGWLTTLSTPFHDFAGSTVVHSVGGFVSLAGAIVLGPRLGRKFKRDGGGMPAGHSMSLAAVGGVILWFGWYGFNPGSTLSALDSGGIGRIAMNTTLAACAGGLVAMLITYPRIKKWDTGITINGFLAGLVAITCPCYWVNSLGAVALGGIAGGVVIVGVELLEYLRIDDPIGAWPVHGLCGIWGTLSLGLFATGDFGAAGPTGMDNSAGTVTGLLYGGGFDQLKAQIIGSAVMCAAAFGSALVLMYVVKATRTLRVSREGELEGLDIHEHGAPNYHWDFGGSGYSLPTPDTSSAPATAVKTPDSVS
jgi:Amt family ammonium transporter